MQSLLIREMGIKTLKMAKIIGRVCVDTKNKIKAEMWENYQV